MKRVNFHQNLIKHLKTSILIVQVDSYINRPAGSGNLPGKYSIKPAFSWKCEPKQECVTNPVIKDFNSNSNNQVAYPLCINVQRCGGDGCCERENHKCVPIEQENVIFTNVWIQYLKIKFLNKT